MHSHNIQSLDTSLSSFGLCVRLLCSRTKTRHSHILAFAHLILRRGADPRTIPQRLITGVSLGAITPLAQTKLYILLQTPLHPLTVAECNPEVLVSKLTTPVIVFPQQRDDSSAGNGRVVVRDPGEEVVSDVVGRNMMHEMRADDAKVPVHCGRGASYEGPRVGCVLW